jgi:hypothetical protein
MDPVTAIAVWGVSLVGIAALVRAATRAATLPEDEHDSRIDAAD